MGKQSRLKATGLTEHGRIERAHQCEAERVEAENKRRSEASAEFLALITEICNKARRRQ